MSVLRDKIIREHIENNYPNGTIVEYNGADSDLEMYEFDRLEEADDEWFPLCCYKDAESGKVIYGGRRKVYHTYTEGETGAGKTTRFVMQAIRALAQTKNKPSFVIVDIHGEIVENLYRHLHKNGYTVKILNCDNPSRSDTYNPFSDMIAECERDRCISSETIDKIRRISEIIQPIESANDPIWDRGARAYTNGCILDKFEDLVDGNISPENITIYNVIQNHYWLRNRLGEDYGTGDIFRIPHYKQKGSKALSIQKMIGVTNNADRTRASYFGVVEHHYDIFGQPNFYKLSSSNTIDIAEFINKPTAIVIQSGSTKIGDDLIAMLVNDIYTRVVRTGKESASKKLPRNIHCFLDEFANCNIADGPDYVKMLTTSRKFGMFWHMILQCDAQLDRKFDQHIGRIIRANSTEIFMGSHDYDTEVRFAKSCGQKTIESLASVVNQSLPTLETVDLMTAERLNLTPEGHAYVKSNRHPLLHTFIEAFYNCDEAVDKIDIESVYPYNDFDYASTLAYPDDNVNRTPREPVFKRISRTEPPKNPFESHPNDDFWNVDFEASIKDNKIYDELATHLAGRDYKEIKGIVAMVSLIPQFLREAIDRIFGSDRELTADFPKQANVLKFEFIEAFIRNNNFKSKIEWTNRMLQECDTLKRHNILPKTLMDALDKACKELKDELTLSNIKEIKKIISDNS